MRKRSTWIRHCAIPLVGLSAIAGACAAATSPFHALTHEFSLLYTVVFAPIAYFAAGRWASSRSEEDGSALSAIVIAGLAAFLGAVVVLLIVAAVNALIWHCAIRDGQPFFWFTWAPAALFAVVLGSVLGARGWGLFPRTLLFLALASFCAIHDAAQLYFGPRVYPVDLLLGDLNVLSQRSTEELTEVHFRHRLFLLAVTIWVWAFSDLRASAGRPMRRWLHAAFGVAVLVVVAVWGSYFGVGVGRGHLDHAYPFREIHGAIRIHHSGSAAALARVDAIAREARWDHRLIAETWNLDSPRTIDVYVLESPEELARYTGIQFAHAGLGEVFVQLGDSVGETLRHEMVHALHHALNPSPRILLSRGYLEGMAMAFANYYALSPDAHDLEAAALRDGNLPAAASLVSPFGFRAVAEHSAYASAGSFLGFLVLSYGIETFIEFQHTLDFEEVYGKTVEDLDTEWRIFLGEVSVPPESAMEAGFLFDTTLHPGYTAMTCPKFGKIPSSLEEEAETLRLRGDFQKAADRYVELYESTAVFSWARWAVDCFEETANYDNALRILEQAEGEDLRPSERAAVIADRIRLLLRKGDWEALYAAYDARAASGLPIPLGNRMGEACLREPAIRETYAATFFERDPYQRGRLWREMLDGQPDFAPLRYTFALAGPSFQSALSARVEAALKACEISSEFADGLARQMMALYNEAMGERAHELAESLSRALLKQCSRPGNRLLGEMGMARIEWERALDSAAAPEEKSEPSS